MRLDKIPAGSLVILRLQSTWHASKYDEERAIFLGIEGRGEKREAKFVSRDGSHLYHWAAYRSAGRWAYGSGAERLQVVDHDDILA